jgi:hypothetical protein
MGQALQSFPPRALPFAPPYALGFSPMTNPGLAYPGTATNPYLTALGQNLLSGNPYLSGGGYGMASMSSSAGLGGVAGTGYGGSGYSSAYSSSYYQDPFNAYLTGAADVIRSQANYMVSAQQANLVKQQVQRDKIENRKRFIEQWLYEREKLPTAQDDRERVDRMELRRIRNNPPATEIYSATALNRLLNQLERLPAGAHGDAAQFPLPEDLASRVNVTPPNRAGNSGLLKDDGRLHWPAALQGDEFRGDRELVESLLPEAVRQATRDSRVTPGTLRDLRDAVDRLQRQLTHDINNFAPSQHVEARRFLNFLDDALKLLGKPDVGNYFNGTYAAKGRTVPDLVQYMKEKGLQFAPATPGDEAAYAALYQALAGYDAATQGQLAAEK